jgi:hypothetical protein
VILFESSPSSFISELTVVGDSVALTVDQEVRAGVRELATVHLRLDEVQVLARRILEQVEWNRPVGESE